MIAETKFLGLTDEEAKLLLKEHGPNILPAEKKKTFLQLFLKTLSEPMILLLFAGATLYFFIGDWQEGLMLSVSVFFVLGISLYQENRSTKALESLKVLSSPKALVFRSGHFKKLPASEVVPGDLVRLSEGDKVPADGFLLESSHVKVDESLLTGESIPVEKTAVQQDIIRTENVPDSSKLFSSTLIISGRALMRVSSTGSKTEVGQIGVALEQAPMETLGLNTEIRELVKVFAISGIAISACLIVAVGMLKNDWLEAFLLGISAQMALLPEEFPVILSIFLALGAWRLSKVKVLVRNPIAIEKLGAITVLCVDKTGTLTENRMSIERLYTDDRFYQFKEIPEWNPSTKKLILNAALACPKIAFDPMEIAIKELAKSIELNSSEMSNDLEIVREFPLTDKLKATAFVWQNYEKVGPQLVVIKGAPEAVLKLCHLSKMDLDRATASVNQMAQQGSRVLAVGLASLHENAPIDNIQDIAFQFIGLLGFNDPIRKEVPEAVMLSKRAGIKVIMMTGDHAETASLVAKKVGIEIGNGVLMGSEVEKMSDDELFHRVKSQNVFARMVPHQKLRLVKILKNQGHTVAMTGDGVNDAPSLKFSDIGISMGARGTEVARESSDIILMDDNFVSIISGIRRGRSIFNNIRKAISYVISIHVPIAGLALLPVFFGWPLILMPAHIVFLEIIIDPVCSLLFESLDIDDKVMHEKPRNSNRRIFSFRDYLRGVLQGGLVLMVLISVLAYLVNQNQPDEKIRATIYLLLIFCNVALIFADLGNGTYAQFKRLISSRENQFGMIGFSIILLFLFGTDFTQKLFQMNGIGLREVLISLFICIVVFLSLNFWNRFKIQKN